MIGLEGDSQPLGYSIYSTRPTRLPRARRSPDVDARTPTSSAPDGSARAAAAHRRRRQRSSRRSRSRSARELLRRARAAERMATAHGATTTSSATARSIASTSASIGSGAGGGTAAHVLTRGRQERARARGRAATRSRASTTRARCRCPLHSNDELKYAVRGYIEPHGLLEPRTFRTDARQPRAIHRRRERCCRRRVGGAFQHADCKTPRFNAVDFRLKSAHGGADRGARPGSPCPASAPTRRAPTSPTGRSPTTTSSRSTSRPSGSTACRATDDNPFASPRSRAVSDAARRADVPRRCCSPRARGDTTFLGGAAAPAHLSRRRSTRARTTAGRRASTAAPAAASAARTTPRARRP